MSCSELAAFFGVNGELLRPRLRRLMQEDLASFQEVANPQAHSPRYLYSVQKARPIVEQMRSKARGAGARTPGPDTDSPDPRCGCLGGAEDLAGQGAGARNAPWALTQTESRRAN
jgi:hypothetical protein